MKKGYQKIVSALSYVQSPAEPPEKRLEELTRRYINAALQMPDEFKAIQLNSSPAILEYTSSLFEGASRKKPALGILCECLRDIFKDRNPDDSVIELTAQILAASTFGLIIKFIIEKDIDEEQRKKLIDHFIKVTIDGMVLGKSLNSN